MTITKAEVAGFTGTIILSATLSALIGYMIGRVIEKYTYEYYEEQA